MDISAGSSAASVYRADEEKMQDCFDEVTDEVEAIFSGFNHKEARIHNKMGRASSKKHVIIFRINMKQSCMADNGSSFYVQLV